MGIYLTCCFWTRIAGIQSSLSGILHNQYLQATSTSFSVIASSTGNTIFLIGNVCKIEKNIILPNL